MPASHGRLIIAIEFALADWVHTYLIISSRAPRRGKLDNSGDFEKKYSLGNGWFRASPGLLVVAIGFPVADLDKT